MTKKQKLVVFIIFIFISLFVSRLCIINKLNNIVYEEVSIESLPEIHFFI